MKDDLQQNWSWNQRKMHTYIKVVIFALVAKIAYHTADALCPSVCECDNGRSLCTQANLTYIPQSLYRYTSSLDLGDNKIFALSNTSFTNVPNLEILKMDSNRISHIEANTFSNLKNLRILSLKDNKINSFPKDLFSSNRKLEILDLSHNALYILPNEAIRYLYNLQVLNVSHNYISSAYLGHSFRYTTHLEYLDLSFNNIARIERDSFLSMAWWEQGQAHHLNLSNSNIQTIQRGAFKDLHPISSLTLSDNYQLRIHSLIPAIRDLPGTNLQSLHLANLSIVNLDTVFKSGKFGNLVHLDLSRNILETIPTGSLYTLEKLESLDLTQNLISDIQTFNDLNNLKILKLNHNRIEYIGSSLDGLQSLQQLHLANNQLTSLSSEPFEDLWDLEFLDISHNSVSRMNIEIGFETLRYLYLEHNDLSEISFLQKLPNLEILDASFNRVIFLGADTFSRAQMITRVNLSYNAIGHIESATFALNTLTHLDLSHNRLEQLGVFGWKNPLKELYLHHNNISYMAPNSLHGLTMLEVLDISHCGLYGFPLQTFADLHLLTTLNMSHNNMGLFLSSPKAQSVFQGMNNLKTLIASNCELTEIPEFLALSKKTLQTIDLCSNEISEIPKDSLDGFVKLGSLNIAHNQISTLDTDIFSDLISLNNLDMSHNPFKCSCDLKPLCDWFTSTEVKIQGFQYKNSAYSCETKDGETFQLSHYCSTVIPQECDAKTRMFFWIILASAVFIAFLVIAVLIYKYCHKKRKRKLKSRASQNIALQKSCKTESEKMMPDTCKYICDDVYKEDML